MTAQEVVTSARYLLDDTTATYRWDNTRLLEYVNDGVRDLVRHRPDLLLDTDHTLKTVSDKNLTDTLILGAGMRQALAYYTASRALSEDGADTSNLQRGELYHSSYMRSLA